MVNTERALEESGIDARLILQVHDELIVEANVSCAEKAKEILQREQSFDTIETTFEHTVKNDRGVEKYYLSDLDQSEGTTRTFGIEAAIYSAMNSGAFLHIDEVEASLHPDLVEFILQKFLATKNRSQLLITTHYDPLLNVLQRLSPRLLSRLHSRLLRTLW